MVLKYFIFITEQFYVLYANASTQITVIDDTIMNEAQLENGYKYLPLKNSKSHKENHHTQSSQVKVNINFIISQKAKFYFKQLFITFMF